MKNKFIITILTTIFLTIPTYATTSPQTNNETQTNHEDIREQAKLLYMGNQLDAAQKHILKIPENEKNAFDYFLIGLTEKDTKNAIKAYEKSISLDEKFYQSYFNIATLYHDKQNYEKAIEYYKLAIKANKKNAYSYFNLGCAYLEAQNYNDARKSFESAIKINPQEADYYYNLGYTYKKLNNKKRADKAIELYNELIKKRNEI